MTVIPSPTLRRLTAGGLKGLALLAMVSFAPLGLDWQPAQLTVSLGAAQAQTTPATAAPTEPVSGPDYAAWNTFAETVEAAVDTPTTSSERLEEMLQALLGWREQFSSAQSTNARRIASLREQIAALGEAPADAAAEPAEIATRRTELAEALIRAQAPGLSAEEAYKRAAGLQDEVNTILRTRSTSEILRRDPAPLSPSNWGDAAAAISKFSSDLWTQTQAAWKNPTRRGALIQALPVIAIGAVLAFLMISRGHAWIAQLIRRLQGRLPRQWWGVIELPLSLAQIILPMAALFFLTRALGQTGFLGPIARGIINEGLPLAVGLLMVLLWIGRHTFPTDDHLRPLLTLPEARQREGRFWVILYGLVTAVDVLTSQALTVRSYGLAVNTATYPLLVASGFILFRLGQLLQQSANLEAEADADSNQFQVIVLSLLGKASMAIGIVGPVLAAVGYVSLGQALVRPAMSTLGLLAVIVLIQRMVYDIYALVTRTDENKARDALIPVLLAFTLVVLALPILALIWGVRSSDLLDYWSRFREGFQIGDSRISPMDFVLFFVVFGLGYGITKLVLGALQSTILPKTRLDTGGKTAILTGVRYLGLILAAFAAITSTGLDLSSLAILAGALSVGIGFGLQNIVQNFVSGVILLIERPVAEGDWVEVGGIQGTVRRISIRSTQVETFDRTTVILPNATLISGQVTNVNGFNQSGRLILPITVSSTNDSRKVSEILLQVAEAQPMVLLNPAPSAPLISYGGGALNFEIRVILRDANFSTSVRSEILHQLLKRFEEEGIDTPAATREVRTFVQVSQAEIDEAAAARSEQAPEAQPAAEPAEAPEGTPKAR